MKVFAYVCAFVGLILCLGSLLYRIPQGISFSTRGLMEFTQTLLLVGICFGVASLKR